MGKLAMDPLKFSRMGTFKFFNNKKKKPLWDLY